MAVAESKELPWYTSSPSKKVDVTTFASAVAPKALVNTCCLPSPAFTNERPSPNSAFAAVIANFIWSGSNELAVPVIA